LSHVGDHILELYPGVKNDECIGLFLPLWFRRISLTKMVLKIDRVV
jgi:hypothetical protein